MRQMTSRDFVYWLQGYFEVTAARDGKFSGNIGEEEIQCIRNHLAMVFKHEIDPSHGDPAHQSALSQAHQGGGTIGAALRPGGTLYRC